MFYISIKQKAMFPLTQISIIANLPRIGNQLATQPYTQNLHVTLLQSNPKNLTNNELAVLSYISTLQRAKLYNSICIPSPFLTLLKYGSNFMHQIRP